MSTGSHQFDHDSDHDPVECELSFENNHSVCNTCWCRNRCAGGLLIEAKPPRSLLLSSFFRALASVGTVPEFSVIISIEGIESPLHYEVNWSTPTRASANS